MLFKNLENDNHLNAYNSLKHFNLDPYILLNDTDMFEYFDKINIYNINCFIKASEIRDKETKLAAYKVCIIHML